MNPVLVPEHHIADHRDQVRQRWEALRATGELQARADRVQATMDHGSFERMTSAATKAKAGGQRVLWLHRAADVLGRAVSQAEAAACKKGCAHCCHIPVLLSRTEAAHLAAASGKKMVATPEHVVQMAQELDRTAGKSDADSAVLDRWGHHIGRACPFLREGACSVWAARPLACRYYYSLDSDNLLCRLLPNQEGVQVPQLNVLAFTAMSWGILGMNQDAADIRDWFSDEI
jgi:Fe-S-cluster containining protein